MNIFFGNHRLFCTKQGLAKAGKESEPVETAAEDDKAWLKLKRGNIGMGFGESISTTKKKLPKLQNKQIVHVSTDKKQYEFEGNIYNETIFLDNLALWFLTCLNINERRGTLKLDILKLGGMISRNKA